MGNNQGLTSQKSAKGKILTSRKGHGERVECGWGTKWKVKTIGSREIRDMRGEGELSEYWMRYDPGSNIHGNGATCYRLRGGNCNINIEGKAASCTNCKSNDLL